VLSKLILKFKATSTNAVISFIGQYEAERQKQQIKRANDRLDMLLTRRQEVSSIEQNL
jgi:hypothetical protein